MTEQSQAPSYDVVPATRDRRKRDAGTFVAVVVASVLLGAPAGLLWSAVAPRFTVQRTDQGLDAPNIESTKAFIGADGSYVVVVFLVGLVCGVLAWRFARRSGPWTVLGLTVGGVLAALIAASVGLRPGASEAVAALSDGSKVRGSVDLFLGARDQSDGSIGLRAAWAAVGWPVGALLAFLLLALQRPEELD